VSGLQVPSQPDLSFGPDTEDRRHRIEAHSEINLPFGVQLGVIVDFRTEAPLDIIANGRDLNGDGSTGDWVNESLCVQRTGVPACPGFNYSRNAVRELTTEQANALRALFGAGQGGPLAPVAQFENNPKYFNADATLQKRFTFGRHGVRLTPRRSTCSTSRSGPRRTKASSRGCSGPTPRCRRRGRCSSPPSTTSSG